ncbi:MAG TPA: nitronate monooxygenase [Candidatus Dormibacteraeota bacterium]
MPTGVLDELSLPVIQAPMAGGPSTWALAAAVSQAGGLGFLAAGYRAAEGVREDIAAVREATARPFGVNLFVPSPERTDRSLLAGYVERVRREAVTYRCEAGEPAGGDDGWAEKLAVLVEERPAVVSLAFGCPAAEVVTRLHDAGIEVWVTVTEPEEARQAAAVGADALVVQGVEAGAHRGAFSDVDGVGEIGLLTLLRLITRVTELPLVASGGLCDGAGVAAVLVAGARAAQLGTAFLDTREAGTSAPHRAALHGGRRTLLTRAFSGRRARGLVNGFLARNSAFAPSAYPQVVNLTAPLRAAARERDDPEMLNLWAGQAYSAIDHDVPAASVVERLAREMREALSSVR